MNLHIMIGLPLSGKSTYCKELQKKGYVVVCPDTVRLAIHGNQFIPIAEPLVWATAQIMVRSLLMQGHNVVIDATNTTVERRKMWVNMANEFDIQLKCHWLSTSKEECLERNEKLQRLNPSIIERMADQFESPMVDGLLLCKNLAEEETCN